MDILRRNTDYALRAMVDLAGLYGNEPIAARQLAQQGDMPYQLTCKILQKLHNARLVESSMGPAGGFYLSRKPSKISLLDVIEAVQGAVTLNRCLLGMDVCPRQRNCSVRVRLAQLQKEIDKYLRSITLEQLSRSRANMGKKNKRKDSKAKR